MVDLIVQQKESNDRRIVPFLGALTNAIAVATPSMALPVLFKEISEDLGLSLVQMGAIWGLGSLTGIRTRITSGTIGDRHCTKHTLMIARFLTSAGGALSCLSKEFSTLSGTVLYMASLHLQSQPRFIKSFGSDF